MKILVSGEGKQDFVNGLMAIAKINSHTDCILVEMDNEVALDGTQYINLINSLDKPVNYGILKQ